MRRTTLILLLALLTFGATLSLTYAAQRSQNGGVSKRAAPSHRDFVGDGACRECHADLVDSYSHTAHHLTSQLPSKDSIAGKFTDGSNVLLTRDLDLRFRMEARLDGFYETAIFWHPPDEKTRSERIDLVTGSGARGQSYLYWRGNQLFQLPVSYSTELRQWINSPGFADGSANFDRPIVPRCLECHATYFESVPSAKAENFYKKIGFQLGISCERCHGPGRVHVEVERDGAAKSGASKEQFAVSRAIVNPANLIRERQMEVCAQCHAGLGEPAAPAFSYVPGQELAKFIEIPPLAPAAPVEVHGNQVGLLERSRCYRSSAMTCSTCHDMHSPERPAADYSEKCLQCHKIQDCGEFTHLREKLSENCIDCHMPLQESNLIVSYSKKGELKAHMRTHWIKAYPPH